MELLGFATSMQLIATLHGHGRSCAALWWAQKWAHISVDTSTQVAIQQKSGCSRTNNTTRPGVCSDNGKKPNGKYPLGKVGCISISRDSDKLHVLDCINTLWHQLRPHHWTQVGESMCYTTSPLCVYPDHKHNEQRIYDVCSKCTQKASQWC